MIAIDANFRLKRRAISNNLRDPALGSGWAYFVEDEPYREHILKYADQEDVCDIHSTSEYVTYLLSDLDVHGVCSFGTCEHQV